MITHLLKMVSRDAAAWCLRERADEDLYVDRALVTCEACLKAHDEARHNFRHNAPFVQEQRARSGEPAVYDRAEQAHDKVSAWCGKTVRHKKTSNVYAVRQFVTLATNGAGEGTTLVLYERCGLSFVRDVVEFADGRFELVK